MFRRSQSINEIWSLVTANPNLVWSLALMHVVPGSGQPLSVLDSQKNMHSDGAAQQAQGQRREDDSVAGVEMWCFGLDVDVGRDNSVKIAPADHYSQDDSALVDAVDVVGDPGERVGDTRVDAHSTEEGSCVLNSWVGRADQKTEAHNPDAGYAHAEVSSEATPVCEPADCNGQDSGAGIRWDREKLRVCSGVTHAA